MEKFSIFLAIVGAFGIGSGAWNIADRYLSYKLERKKILFEKKFKAYAELSECILGFALHEKGEARNVFQNLAASANARLLTSDKKLDEKICIFFVKLDEFVVGKEESASNEADYMQLQKDGQKIIEELNKDLKNTI